MRADNSNLEEFLGAILRGAAKILGCSSTNLVLINERSQMIRVVLGAMAVSFPTLEKIEGVLGRSFSSFSLPLRKAKHSLIYRAFREGQTMETASLAELVGDAFGPLITAEIARIAGHQRFSCVPAVSGNRHYGVLLFTKEGQHPFTKQQRQVLVRCAQRVGEIVENDLVGQGQLLIAEPAANRSAFAIFDSDGRRLGGGPFPSAVLELLQKDERAETALAEHARRLSADESPRDGATFWWRAAGQETALPVELCRLRVRGETWVIATLPSTESRREGSLENHLMQMALGEPAPALFVDREFRITSCNEATEQVLGYPQTELLHQPISTLFRSPREILELLQQQLLDPKSPYGEERGIVQKSDQSLLPARIEALLLADERHEVVGFLVLIRVLLEGDVHTDDGVVVKERLATMGEMATQLAHEIRNPLLAIGATLESLSRELATNAQAEILRTLAGEIGRLDMLLKDYLSVRHELSFSAVKLCDVLEDARRLLAGGHPEAQQAIAVEVDRELTTGADYEGLKHVCFNLLLNALEASRETVEVTCRATTTESDITIYIEDRGSGLSRPAEDCLRPFVTTKKHGTGLGLAVCQKIIRAHGGIIGLRDRDGGGCQASVILPRRAAT